MEADARHRDAFYVGGDLLVGFAGTRRGAAALAPAAQQLRAALSQARLLWLWPAHAGAAPDGDGRFDYPLPDGGRDTTGRASPGAALPLVVALRAASPVALVVFCEPGYAPYVPAMIGYLAGIERRAGFETEFGGGVLSDPVRPPPRLPARTHHLMLLRALGLNGGTRAFARGEDEDAVTGRRRRCVH